MALFFQAALANKESIFQNDKTEDRKFFCNFTARGTLGNDPLVSVPTAVLTTSFPLNAELVELKSVFVKKKISMINAAGLFTIEDLKLTGLPVPHIDFTVLLGLGDQQANINILNLVEFNKQNQIFLPLILNSTVDQIDFSGIKERFKLDRNQTFLNAFIFMSVADVGDVTAFQTDFNAMSVVKGAAFQMGNYLFDISVFVSGKTSLKG